MKAAMATGFGPPSVLRIETIDTPALAPGEVLVKVHASSVTPLDTYLRKGVPVGAYTPAPPYTPGAALAGTVESVGSGVIGIAPGSRVYGRARSGSAAEYAACLADEVYSLPANIDFADGAVIAVPFETAYYSLVDLAGAGGGETALIHGAAGSVGAAAVQIARSMGLRVIATCALADRDAVLANGADLAIDYARSDLTDAIRAAAGDRGVDVAIEVAARSNLARDLELAATGGRIVIVGGTGQTPFDALPVIAKGLRISGVDLRSMTSRRAAQIHAALYVGLADGRFRPRAAHRFSLVRIADAHAAIEAGRVPGGVVVEIEAAN